MDQLDKLTRPAVGQSQALRKVAEIRALLDEMRNTIADTAERLDCIEKVDQRRAAMQKFLLDVPINGAQRNGGINAKLEELIECVTSTPRRV